jgi:hypothetical protein
MVHIKHCFAEETVLIYYEANRLIFVIVISGIFFFCENRTKHLDAVI